MKKRIFYKVYFSLLIVFFVCLAIFLIWLNSFISDYNKGLAQTVSKEFFENTFETLDSDKIIELSGFKTSEFETPDDVKKYLEKNFSSPLTYTSVSSGEDEKKYIVKSGDYKVADFTLMANEKGDFEPSSVTLFLPESTEKTVKILSTSKLFVNGFEVSNTYETLREPHESKAHLPDSVPCPEWVTYTISGLVGEAKLEVLDRNGNKPELTCENEVLVENIIWDEPDAKAVERIYDGAIQYATCMQNDASKSSVYPYFESGTDLYRRIQSVENMFALDHNGYEFEDGKTSEFFRYDENTVSVRVSFVHILKMHGREDYRNYTDITYIARLVDGEYLIYSFYNN